LADLVHAQRTRRGETASIVDVGLNHEVSDGLSLGAAVGFGIGARSPDFRAILALRKTFGVW
jgi:hypothetical protein